MDLLIDGKRDKEIAFLLGVKQRTVVHRIYMVCSKLGALTRSQAAAIYARSKA